MARNGKGYRPQISPQAIEQLRAKISTGMLVTRLQDFALGEPIMEIGAGGIPELRVRMPNGTTRPAMTKEQIAAAKLLLDKVLPSPQAIDVTSHETKTFVIRAPEPAKDMDDWLKQYGPKTIEGSVQ